MNLNFHAQTLPATGSRLFIVVIAATTLLASACDRKEQPTHSPTSTALAPEPDRGGAPEETSHDDEVHLGEHMNEIDRRFAAIWYAGEAKNGAMLDYQLHELEEAIDELREPRPIENEIDVHARLVSDVRSRFDALEKAVEGGDVKAFEQQYQGIMARCSACHAETGHPYIVVTTPEYNPYPNVAF